MIDLTDRKHTEEALKEREERFRSIFDNSLDGIMLTKPSCEVISLNAAAL
jgi:PAS domain S-box-containing protein